MKELTFEQVEDVSGGTGRSSWFPIPPLGEITTALLDEVVDFIDGVAGIVDGFQGDRDNDPNPKTKK